MNLNQDRRLQPTYRDPDDDAPRLPVRLLWNPSWSEFPQAVTHA